MFNPKDFDVIDHYDRRHWGIITLIEDRKTSLRFEVDGQYKTVNGACKALSRQFQAEIDRGIVTTINYDHAKKLGVI